MSEGVIYKALSGFYYIADGTGTFTCKAKGKFRHSGLAPLVGDRVVFTEDGIIDEILERKNSFIRPAVANIDVFVFVASNAKPVTDPFLIDRVSVIAESAGCEFILALNKNDLENTDELFEIYSKSGFKVFKTSAATGEGIDDLLNSIKGRISVFTGNSGVGKSSILNNIIPNACIETAEISDKLGRGKHTTRHIEFYSPCENTYIADTPGFASFDIEMIDEIDKEELQYDFIDFVPYLGKCRFNDCRHISEPGCNVREKVEKSRHESYVKLYDIISNHKSWD